MEKCNSLTSKIKIKVLQTKSIPSPISSRLAPTLYPFSTLLLAPKHLFSANIFLVQIESLGGKSNIFAAQMRCARARSSTSSNAALAMQLCPSSWVFVKECSKQMFLKRKTRTGLLCANAHTRRRARRAFVYRSVR